MKNIISGNYFNSQKNKDDDEIKRIIANVQNVDSEFLDMGNEENDPRKINESQRVF